MIPFDYLIALVGTVGILATVAFVSLGALAVLGQPDDHRDWDDAERYADHDLGVREVSDE